MHLDLDRVPPHEESRPHRLELRLTTKECNWITAFRDEAGNTLYRITGTDEELPPEEELAYLCLRAGMVALYGVMTGVPQEFLYVMLKRELAAFYDEDTVDAQEG